MAKKFTIEAIFRARDFLSKPIAKIKGNLGALGSAGAGALKGLDGAVNRSIKGLGKLSNVLGIASVLSVAALGVEFQKTMEVGQELEKIIARTGAALDTPVKVGSKGFAELSAAARRVGMTTEFSAVQGAEALNALATAGYTAEQSIGSLPRVIDFASAATLELGVASDIASNTLGTFSLRSKDAETNTRNMARVMDALTRTAADSTTNVAELFEGITAGGAASATSGASLEEYVALQGILANKGFKGAEAGTALRNAYLHLTKPTKEATQKMAALGVKIARTESGAIDMTTTIGRFTKATAKLTGSQKANAIATVFGAFTYGQFLSLMNAGEGTIRDFTSNIRKATGTTREMAEAMRASKAARIARFWNVIEGIRLTVFEAIAPAVLDIAEAVGKWVTANEELIGTKAGEWAATLRDNLPEIASGAERVAKALAGFAIITGVVKAVSLLASVISGLSVAFAWLEFTALLVGTTVGAILWPILLIGAAIAGLVALAYAYWPEITAFFSGIYDAAVKAIGGVWEWIKGAFDTIKGYVGAIFEFIVGLLSIVFAPGIEAVKLYVSLVAAWLDFLVSVIKAIWAPLSEWFATLWGGLVDAQSGYFDLVVGVWSGLLGFFSGVWQGIADAFTRIVGPIIDTARGIINTIRAAGRMTLGTDGAEGDGAPARPKPGEGPPRVISPQERAAAAAVDAGGGARVDGTITVEATAGTKATAKTKRGTIPIAVQPSGAFG